MSGVCNRVDGCQAMAKAVDVLERQQAHREALEVLRATVVADLDALRVEVVRKRTAALMGHAVALVAVVILVIVRYWGLS